MERPSSYFIILFSRLTAKNGKEMNVCVIKMIFTAGGWKQRVNELCHYCRLFARPNILFYRVKSSSTKKNISISVCARKDLYLLDLRCLSSRHKTIDECIDVSMNWRLSPSFSHHLSFFLCLSLSRSLSLSLSLLLVSRFSLRFSSSFSCRLFFLFFNNISPRHYTGEEHPEERQVEEKHSSVCACRSIRSVCHACAACLVSDVKHSTISILSRHGNVSNRPESNKSESALPANDIGSIVVHDEYILSFDLEFFSWTRKMKMISNIYTNKSLTCTDCEKEWEK